MIQKGEAEDLEAAEGKCDQRLRMQLTNELQNDYRQWKTVYEYGHYDPFWADGSNLFLIRNHIIADKKAIRENLKPEDYPEEYAWDLPQEVPSEYMERPDEIMTRAGKALKAAKESQDYRWMKNHLYDERFSPSVRKKAAGIFARILAYENAIRQHDLVTMRRFGQDGFVSGELADARAGFLAEQSRGRTFPEGQLSIFDYL